MYTAGFIFGLFLAATMAVNAAPHSADESPMQQEVRSVLSAATSVLELDRRAATNTSLECAQATILAFGIAQNIMDQMQEQAALAKVKTALAANPVDTAGFKAAKTQLLTFINNGIEIRKSNQFITPCGNPATAGLAIVANAQIGELGLATNLTGNPATDMAITTTLATDFAGGIVQNMKNMAAATQTCTPGVTASSV